jgi:hypothetical protein
MLPQPLALAIRDPQSAITTDGDSLMAETSAPTGANEAVQASPSQIQAALRIRAALRAAHQDVTEDRLPNGEWHEWTWTVKATPRPPLVSGDTQVLKSEDLLANDSLGG